MLSAEPAPAYQPAASIAASSRTPSRRPIEVIGTDTAPRTAVKPRGSDSSSRNETVEYNFVDADIKDVVKSVLSATLHIPYVIDSRVQGTLTLQTGRPVPGATH